MLLVQVHKSLRVLVTDLLGVCVERHSQIQQQLPLLHPLDEGLQPDT